MSQSSDSSDWVEPGSPSDAASAIYCDEEISEQQSITNSNDSEEVEQQSMAKVPQASEEVEQQSKVTQHDDSGLDLLLSSRLPAITNVESLKETILESQTIVAEFDPGDPHSCADVADCDQQGVRVFTPRNFSFQELLNSNAAGCLNSDWSELGAPSDAAPSDAAPSDAAPSVAAPSNAAPSNAAANEVEKRIPDHNNNDWKEWLINLEGDV